MRLKLFIRSFFNQALINYRGMTHLGILWALLPQLKNAGTGRRQMLERAFGFFNSHPYMAGYIIGASATMEEHDQGELLEKLKRATVSPLGAVGDRLFWFYLKPLSGVLACSGMIVWLNGWPVAGILLLAAALLGYNALHIWIRWRGISLGLQLGHKVYKDIVALKEHRLNQVVAASFSLCAGLFLGIGFSHAHITGLSWTELGGLALITVLSWQLPERNWALPVFLISLAAGILVWNESFIGVN